MNLSMSDYGAVTLVGIHHVKGVPSPHGNCMSVTASNNKWYHITNANYENLKGLIDSGIMSFPIEIESLDKDGLDESHCAKIIDKRMPEEWKDKEPCNLCTPRKYWSANQIKREEDDITSGRLKIWKYVDSDGKERTARSYLDTSSPTFKELALGFNVIEEIGEAYIDPSVLELPNFKEIPRGIIEGKEVTITIEDNNED